MLLAQFIFAHSIGFEIYKIVVVLIFIACGLQIRTNGTNGKTIREFIPYQ